MWWWFFWPYLAVAAAESFSGRRWPGYWSGLALFPLKPAAYPLSTRATKKLAKFEPPSTLDLGARVLLLRASDRRMILRVRGDGSFGWSQGAVAIDLEPDERELRLTCRYAPPMSSLIPLAACLYSLTLGAAATTLLIIALVVPLSIFHSYRSLSSRLPEACDELARIARGEPRAPSEPGPRSGRRGDRGARQTTQDE